MISVQGQYSKSFHSDKLSKTKFDNLRSHAVLIRDIRNEISQKVNENLFHFLDMSKYDFYGIFTPVYNKRINSNFSMQAFEDVYVAYQNKFDAIQTKLRFETVYDYHFTFYKRKSKDHNKGDFKGVSKKKKSTPLSIALTYLARYGSESTQEYLENKLSVEIDASKKKFFENIVAKIQKFGFDRLMRIALSKRNRTVKQYSAHPIEFKSLTFRGRSRFSDNHVSFNRKKKSAIMAFVKIGWTAAGKHLTIPVKYSAKYHGKLDKYHKATHTYTICFEENKSVKVVLSYEGDRDFPVAGSNVVGVDVNVKHNLLKCSNGDSIDYDRELVETLSKELQKVDERKSKNKNYAPGKRTQHKIDHLRRELKSKIRFEISQLCKRFNSQSIDHAVFENLTGFAGKCYAKDENDLNYNRKIREIGLSSLKDEFEHIARKYGVATSLVHSEYTSQQCPKCGCIDSENRKSQEVFACVECGFATNADDNASQNIKQRLVSTVLRNELLKKNPIGNNAFLPKALKKDHVKNILLSCRSRVYKLKEVNKVS